MHKIFKYPLVIHRLVEVPIPKDARILKIDAQYDQPCLWALVDTDNEPETRSFIIQGTGWAFDKPLDDLTYIDSFQMSGGQFVWHVFEYTPHKH
jgi:hypothetical protein